MSHSQNISNFFYEVYMKGKFVLLVLFGLFLVSCGNSFNTKSSKGDTVDVSLQIPLEILASASSREASVTSTSNSLEVSLFVNDEEPIKKTVKNFSKSASISFKNITIGSMVKAQAKLVYQGKEYSGESKSTIVTADGTELSLILKSKSNTEEKTAGISLYFDDILLTVYPQEHNTTIQTIKTELSLMGFEEETDFTVQDNKIYLTESGLDKFLIMVSENEREPAELLLVYNKRMIGAITSKDAGLIRASLSQEDYETRYSGKIFILKTPSALQAYANMYSQDENVFQNEVSGQISINEVLEFSKWDLTVDNKVRYMATISLNSILGERHLAEGDTVAFVFTTSYSITEFYTYNVKQFYYQLQIDDWQTIGAEHLFDNNKCINFEPENNKIYTFVMPLNLINNPSSYCNLQLFFDCPEGTDVESLSLYSSIAYYIFPAAQRTVVFGVGTNWSDETNQLCPYRYEIDLPLVNSANVMYNLAEGQKVSVKLSGTLNYYEEYDNIGEDKLYTANYDLIGEVYDGADYTVADNFKRNNNDYYHPLSQNNVGDTDKRRSITDGIISSNGLFIFDSIQAPFYDRADAQQNPDHNYRFQCYVPCHKINAKGEVEPLDATTLLVIKDFDVEMTLD